MPTEKKEDNRATSMEKREPRKNTGHLEEELITANKTMKKLMITKNRKQNHHKTATSVWHQTTKKMRQQTGRDIEKKKKKDNADKSIQR